VVGLRGSPSKLPRLYLAGATQILTVVSLALAAASAASACSTTTSNGPASGDAGSGSVCAQWSVAGAWTTQQADGLTVTLLFTQQGQAVGGTAHFTDPTNSANQGNGTVSGTLIGSQLNVVIAWSGFDGYYVANVSAGQLVGAVSPMPGGGGAVMWSGSGSTSCQVDGGTDAGEGGIARCATPCSAAHGTPSCATGTCSIACDPGFADCNNDRSDGCEVDVNTAQNCGGCGTTCTTGQQCTDEQCTTLNCGNATVSCGGACCASCNQGCDVNSKCSTCSPYVLSTTSADCFGQSTVLDPSTGLTWTLSEPGQDLCPSATNGWQLPSLSQLQSILTPSKQGACFLNACAFSWICGSFGRDVYASSTAGSTSLSYMVLDFTTGVASDSSTLGGSQPGIVCVK
jgi:hypothetical protein